MKTATVRDLRNHFSRIAKWLRNGDEVLITMRGKAIGRIVPELAPQPRITMPDFAARIAKDYPHRQISASESAALRNALRGDR
jgi:antitoxin (DNA-binding transcriptional repressor) of toxin-antitoxin stability system